MVYTAVSAIRSHFRNSARMSGHNKSIFTYDTLVHAISGAAVSTRESRQGKA
jgi:hypothetical protein